MKRILLLAIIVFGLAFTAQAQTRFTVTYTEQGPQTVLAIVTAGTARVWDHYLSADEQKLLASDPAILDAQIGVATAKILAQVPVTPPVPKQVRVSGSVDPTTAQTAADNFKTAATALDAGIAAALVKAAPLPLTTKQTLLTQIQALVDAELAKLPK